MGNSVGVQNPYPTMPPISQGEGCIGCGSSGIVGIDDNSPLYINGQRATLAIDGLKVTRHQFRSYLNLMLTAVGHSSDGLGVAEHAAELSQQQGWRYTYTTSRGETRTEDFTMGVSQVYLDNLVAETGTISPIYNSNWSPNYALLSQNQKLEERKLTEKEVSRLRNNVELLLKNQDCATFIENVLNTARELFPKQAMYSDYLLGMFDEVVEQKGL